MIVAVFNKEKYFYDVHSLVRAFYQQEEVVCFVRGERNGLDSTAGSIRLDIDLREEIGEIAVTMTRAAQGRTGGPEGEEAARGRAGVPEGEEAAKRDIGTADGPSTRSVTETVSCIPSGEGERVSSIDCTPVFDADGNRRYNAKNALKRLLYRMLSQETGRGLPWGSLTGIRPTHIPRTLLAAGWERSAIQKEMADTFYVSEKKAALALEVAERERTLLAGEDYAAGYSLYIGIPFCPTTCLYCSFPSYPVGAWESRVGDYLSALEREMDFAAERFCGVPLHTIYIGGGTPTSLTPAQSDRLLSAIETRFALSCVREFTVEAGRPDSLTQEKVAVLREHKVSRVSINPQSMKQRTLDLIGRRHTAEDVRRAFALVRGAGDFHINMDLILGLPGESAADVADTLEEISALQPDDLTLHALAVKRGSRLQALTETQGVHFPAFADIEGAAAVAEESARRMGLFPYYLYRQKNIAGNFENTGYARARAEGLYNVLINEDVHSIVALGAGAISKRVSGDAVTRAENVKELAQYLERVDEMIERKRRLYE